MAACDTFGRLTGFSNTGPEIDLLATGQGIVSADVTVSGDDDLKTTYSSSNGTSMAAPYVTAAVAMLRAWAPDLSPEATRRILMRSARVTSEGYLKLDVNRALSLLYYVSVEEMRSDAEKRERFRRTLKERLARF